MDVAILVFTSQYPESSDKNFNHRFAEVYFDVMKKFQEQKVKTVRFYAIDINADTNVFELGKFNDVDEAPAVILFPAINKGNVQKFYGKLVTRDVGRFIHRASDIRFEMWPDRLDEEAPRTEADVNEL